MKAKLVKESLDELFEKKSNAATEKAKIEKETSVKVINDIKEKIAALKKKEKELESELQKQAGPIAKSKIKIELDEIKEKISKWNKKL